LYPLVAGADIELFLTSKKSQLGFALGFDDLLAGGSDVGAVLSGVPVYQFIS